MVVLIAAGLSWTGQRLADAPDAAGRGAIATTEELDTEHQDVEAHYATAIARLEQITSAERSLLDPDTAGVLDAGLSVIDEAIAQSRAALGTQPESELAQDSLYQALSRKVTVLQAMLALINEMRRGDVVRVVSELNP
jgi:phosphoenolpyruvate-protein kinase (PTS system EI component)